MFFNRGIAPVRLLLGGFVIAAITLGSAAEAAHYIRDVVYVPLRSGPTAQHRILENLKSGDRVEVVEGNFASAGPADYLRVTTSEGVSGWLEKQYLVGEPVARQRLDAVEAELALAEQRNSEMQQRLATLTGDQRSAAAELERLQQSETALEQELAEVRAASAEGLRLHDQYQRLSSEHEQLTRRASELQGDNERLQDELQRNEFMRGAYAVAIGVVLALIIPRLWPRRRRTDWG